LLYMLPSFRDIIILVLKALPVFHGPTSVAAQLQCQSNRPPAANANANAGISVRVFGNGKCCSRLR
ncbi:MAG: hypothetical protein KAS54_05200, partial [Dehalococcoidia bacterium]|nr:hypothetical protein [Dehalococcoidia bacterium]